MRRATVADTTVMLSGIVKCNATAGALTLQFAQNTSDPTPTVLVAGSWLELTRIA